LRELLTCRAKPFTHDKARRNDRDSEHATQEQTKHLRQGKAREAMTVGAHAARMSTR